ncbi:MAG: hypothetical protein WA399_06790 [Acidobacteriaceae bacterium]
MDANRHLLKTSSEKMAAAGLGLETRCVHCYRSLGVMRNAAQRAKTEARHMCGEKRLSRQPAAPPPFN